MGPGTSETSWAPDDVVVKFKVTVLIKDSIHKPGERNQTRDMDDLPLPAPISIHLPVFLLRVPIAP